MATPLPRGAPKPHVVTALLRALRMDSGGGGCDALKVALCGRLGLTGLMSG